MKINNKIERTKDFKELLIGECFLYWEEEGISLFLKTQKIGNFNAVCLDTNFITAFDDEDLVFPVHATLTY